MMVGPSWLLFSAPLFLTVEMAVGLDDLGLGCSPPAIGSCDSGNLHGSSFLQNKGSHLAKIDQLNEIESPMSPGPSNAGDDYKEDGHDDDDKNTFVQNGEGGADADGDDVPEAAKGGTTEPNDAEAIPKLLQMSTAFVANEDFQLTQSEADTRRDPKEVNSVLANSLLQSGSVATKSKARTMGEFIAQLKEDDVTDEMLGEVTSDAEAKLAANKTFTKEDLIALLAEDGFNEVQISDVMEHWPKLNKLQYDMKNALGKRALLTQRHTHQALDASVHGKPPPPPCRNSSAEGDAEEAAARGSAEEAAARA
jgi:hypothetical protein